MKKILVIDDEINIINTISQILKRNNLKPITSTEAHQAIDLFAREKPDLALIDIWMAEMDGYTLLHKLKQIKADTPVIMMSGHANITTSVETVKLGAEDFLEKPFSADYLIFKIKQLLEPNHHKKKLSSKKNVKLEKLLVEVDERQRTIAKNLVITGKGLHQGKNTGIILSPLPENSGIIFKDISSGEIVKASIENIADSNFYGTTLQSKRFSLTVIEHLLSALHIYGIDNLQVKVSEEIPILNGSSDKFCKLLEEGGIKEQASRKKVIVVDKEYSYQDAKNQGIHTTIEPYDDLCISYSLEFPSAFGKQFFSVDFSKIKNRISFYKREIAPCRTFGFLAETKNLQAAGMAQGANLDNALLVHENQVINTKLKFKDEFARHKVLDIIGDLYLLGYPVRGKITAQKSGHRHTVELMKKMLF